MFVWNNPTSESEADAIIENARKTIHDMDEDELELACQKLALFAGAFNHFWTSSRRTQLINILVGVGLDAVDPVLQALVSIPRSEQFDITNRFIRELVLTAEDGDFNA
jgi:hypothetical protein